MPCNCTRLATRYIDLSGTVVEDCRYDRLLRIEQYQSPIDHDMFNDKCPESNQTVRMIDLSSFPKPIRQHVGNGTYNGPYAFTLTKSPKDPQTAADMIAAAKKIMSQKSCLVKKYAWYLEYKGTDESGLPAHPHIHGMYETVTGGRIEAKHFKRAWPIWEEKIKLGAGFRGGYHRPVKSEESYNQYICKDGGVGQTNGLE